MKKSIKIRNFVLRILASPFIYGVVFIKFNFHALYLTYGFIKIGGEFIPYSSEDKCTIKDIYEELKKSKK